MAALQYKEQGEITRIRGCIVCVEGFENCINGQLVQFGYGTEGIIIGFDEHETQVLLVKQRRDLRTGDEAVMTLEPFRTPVGDSFIGRVVDPLGLPLDNLKPIKPDSYAPIFDDPPSVMDRDEVTNTLETGIKILDSMIPIGKGQRQLILGDKMTGKTTIGTDIILNQRGKDVKCIYCAIGKSKTAVDRVIDLFKKNDVFDYTMILAAIAGTSPGQQYLVPYFGSSLGEHFMRKGEHVLVVFDDFTKHAWAYRELSLLLMRPPGRESYPGDIFYLHSRMIERAAQLSKDLGSGTMTFLPVVEVLEGDLSGYVPTNLISMTDGQIYLNASLFQENFKPAIDIGLSVSRIGSKAQWPIMKSVSKSLRLEYLRHREALLVSKFKTGGGGEDDEAKSGRLLAEMLGQVNDKPLSMIEEVILLFGLSKKLIFELDDEQRERWGEEIYDFAKEKYPELLEKIEKERKLTDEIEETLRKLYAEFIKKLQDESALRMQEEETEEEKAEREEAEEAIAKKRQEGMEEGILEDAETETAQTTGKEKS